MNETTISEIDEKILRYAATYSPEEISVKLGGIASPGRIAARVQALLHSRDWLTSTQQDQLITFKLQRILLDFEDRVLDVDNAKIRISLLKDIGVRLEKRQAATEVDLGRLYANQGAIMGRVFDNALTYMEGALRDKVDPELWAKLKEEALYSAQAEVAKYEAIEA